MDDEITKKELLELTGISYGQLYRWKRERLLPDAWFRKRASHTGQETYLPREEALERIRAILRMKDSFSHEEISAFFNPVMTARQYVRADLSGLIAEDALNALTDALGRDTYAYGELLFAIVLEDLSKHGIPPTRLTAHARDWIPRLTDEGVRVTAVRHGGTCFAVLVKGEAFFEDGASVVYQQTSAQLIERLKSRVAPILS